MANEILWFDGEDISWWEKIKSRGEPAPKIDSGPNRYSIAARLKRQRQAAFGGLVCESCSTENDSNWEIHLHHVIPIAVGGPNEYDNTMLLCRSCHYMAHYIWHDDDPQLSRASYLEVLRRSR